MIKRYKEFIIENTDPSLWWDINLEKSILLNDYKIKNYRFNPDTGYIDVYQNVDLYKKGLKNLPEIRFGEIFGYFTCAQNELTSLKNCPQKVNGSFFCNSNNLKTLEFCPKEVEDDFCCDKNQLPSLRYCPEKIGGHFTCYDNELTSLEHCPKYIGKDFDCAKNKLTSLKGCPEIINGIFDCTNNFLTSLEHCPKYVKGDFKFYDSNTRNHYDNNISFIDDYPLCIIDGKISELYENIFNDINFIVKDNEELFIPLLDDKIKFHQMIMRIDPSFIRYYKTIPPPTKNSKLLL